MAKRVSQPKTASQSEESTQPKRVAQPKRAAQPKRPAQPKRAGQPKPKRPAQPRRATQPKRKRSTADNGGLPPRRSRRLNPQLFLPHSLHTIPWEISELIYGYLDQDDLDNLRLSSRAIYDRLELNGYRDLTISISDWNHRKIKIVLNDPRWLANINSIKLNSLILAAPPDIDVNRLIRVAAGLTSDADLDANTVQNPLITQQRIIYFAQAVGEQRRILAHKAFFKDLSYLLQRCQNLERIEMRCVASVDAFEENMEQAFPDMIFDEIPLDNWIRIDEPCMWTPAKTITVDAIKIQKLI